MRILILTPTAGDHFGQERLVRDTSRLLRSVGHEVYVLADDFNGEVSDYNGIITVKGGSVIHRFTPPRELPNKLTIRC